MALRKLATNIITKVDAKIMSKVILARIKNVLPNIIHHNHTRFTEDRYIGETVRLIFHIMELTVEGTFSGSNDFYRLSKRFRQFGVELSFKLSSIF